MDREPWTYRVSAQEARREGRVSGEAAPGDKAASWTRAATLTLEACAPATDATSPSFSACARRRDGTVAGFDSSGGLADFRIAREPIHFPTGCFRGAVALPAGTTAADVVSLAIRAHTRPLRDKAETAAGAGQRCCAPRPRQPALPPQRLTMSRTGPCCSGAATPRSRGEGPAYRDTRTRKGGESMNESRSSLAREVAAEFLGTFVLIVFGIGGGGAGGPERRQPRRLPLDQHRLGPRGHDGASTRPAGVSGAHLNPAVTLAAGRAPRLPLAQGAALCRGAGRGRLRRVRA